MHRFYTITTLLPLLLHSSSSSFIPNDSKSYHPTFPSSSSSSSFACFHYTKLQPQQQPQPQPLLLLHATNEPKPGFINGPPLETKPDYETLHGPFGKTLDRWLLVLFRTKMAENVGVDSDLPADNYQGLMELTTAMNARYSDRKQVQRIAQDILRSLFPSWLPSSFSWMFAKPFPKFSARMNAWATMTLGTWLMGECELYDIELPPSSSTVSSSSSSNTIPTPTLLPSQGVLVKRCRFLEESGCASVCVNSCKIPTQNFFAQDMGIPLTMTPDYETGECRFEFGLEAEVEGEREAMDTPCLVRCPSLGGMRKWHEGDSGGGGVGVGADTLCPLMDDDMLG